MSEEWKDFLESQKKIAEGNTAEVYLWEDDKVLKLFKAYYEKTSVEKEFHKACEIQTFISDAPKAYKVIQLNNRYGILYQKVDGKTMSVELEENPLKAKEMGCQMAKIHLKIHQQNLAKQINLSIINKVEDTLNNNFLYSKNLSDEEKDEMRKLLLEMPKGESLCHMDFHPGNIMNFKGQWTVIDWNDAVIANPLCDVARTMLLLKINGLNESNFLKRWVVTLLCRQLCTGYLRQYRKIKPYDKKELNKWEVLLSAARLSEHVSDNEKKALKKNVTNYIKNKKRKTIL